MFILVVPDSIKQLMAYSNLEKTSGVWTSKHPFKYIRTETLTKTCPKHTKAGSNKTCKYVKCIYRIYRRDIGDSFSFSTTCRSRGGDIIEVPPSAHTAGGWSGSSPLRASWHRWIISPASPLAAETKIRLTVWFLVILVRLPFKRTELTQI